MPLSVTLSRDGQKIGLKLLENYRVFLGNLHGALFDLLVGQIQENRSSVSHGTGHGLLHIQSTISI